MVTGFTLGDLLADSHLNLELMTGPTDSLSRPLHGAHSIEIDNPAQWLDPGWLMLTMGVRLRQRPAEQRRLIAELQELGATALGFGVGVAFKSVPPTLLEEAAARDFPVIKVPIDTQFHEISRVVFQSTVSSEAQTYARLTSLQQNLMRAFADPNPVVSALRRLGRFSNSTVAVVAADGTVQASTGILPLDEISGHLLDRPVHASPVVIGDWEIVTAPIGGWQSPRSLVIASRPGATSREMVRMMLDVAVPMLGALGSFTAANRRHDQALSKAMVDNALTKPLSDVDAGQFSEHLTSADVDVARGFAVVVMRSGEHVLLDEIEGALVGAHRRLPSVYSRRREEIVAVVSADDGKIAGLRHALGARIDRLRTGVGRTVSSPHEISVSYRDAVIVLRYLDQEEAGAALTFDDLDLASQLLAEVHPDRVALKVKTIADLLRSNPIQLEALRAYFATCQDVQAAAKSIFVHPNTLRYRLERFEMAMGRSLRDPAIIASLHYVLSSMSNSESGAEDVPALGAITA